MALGFVEVFVEVSVEAFAGVLAGGFVSDVGNGVMRALFASGDCDGDAALWLSDVSGVDEAADEP